MIRGSMFSGIVHLGRTRICGTQSDPSVPHSPQSWDRQCVVHAWRRSRYETDGSAYALVSFRFVTKTPSRLPKALGFSVALAESAGPPVQSPARSAVIGVWCWTAFFPRCRGRAWCSGPHGWFCPNQGLFPEGGAGPGSGVSASMSLRMMWVVSFSP